MPTPAVGMWAPPSRGAVVPLTARVRQAWAVGAWLAGAVVGVVALPPLGPEPRATAGLAQEAAVVALAPSSAAESLGLAAMAASAAPSKAQDIGSAWWRAAAQRFAAAFLRLVPKRLRGC